MGVPPSDEDYQFNSIDYLRAKNHVDEASFNKDVMNKVTDYVTQIRTYRQQVESDKFANDSSVFMVVDMGSGVLNMLRHVLLFASNLMDRGDEFK